MPWLERGDLEVRDGRARGVAVERVPGRMLTIASDRSLDPPPPGPGPAVHEREVDALERPSPDEGAEPVVGLLAAGDDHQPGGVPVETVDDAGALGRPSGQPVEQAVDERAGAVTGPGVYDEACRLVHDEQVLVLVGEAQPHLLLLQRGCHRRLELDLGPRYEPVALRAPGAVHEYGVSREQPVGRRARADLGQAREEAVEALPGGLGGDANPDQDRTAASPEPRLRGLRSAETSAARRSPTPTTMKLSARLKAGQ
jgi:hypothetical protein